MREQIDFFKLEKLANKVAATKKYEPFFQVIRGLKEECGLDHALRALKQSGICVDPYGNNRFGGLFIETIRMLTDLIGSDERINRLVREAGLLNRLFRDFEQLRYEAGVETVPIKRKVASFLIGLEIALGAGMEHLNNQTITKIKQKYPFVFGLVDNNGPMKQLRGAAHEQYWALLDSMGENSGLVLKYLLHNNAPFIGLRTTMSIDEIRITRRHLQLIDQYDRLFLTLECWKFIDSKVELDERGDIIFDPVDKERFLRHRTANYRTRSMRKTWDLQFQSVQQDDQYDPKTTLMPPKHVRSPKEHMASVFCREFFGSDFFDEEILEVPLYFWLRAYEMLAEEGERVIKGRDDVRSLTLNQWAIVKTKEEWIALIASGGIHEAKAAVIVDNLIFNRYSKDPFDCPLIPIDDYLVALPSILCMVEPSVAMLSNFTGKGININFKGEGFEKRVRDKITRAGFPCVELHYRGKEGEFQCDAVFVIDQDLYFVECKSQGYPFSYREHEILEQNIQKDSKQQNRIFDFFSHRLDLVRGRLQLPDDWVPRSLYQMLLYQSTHGRREKVNDCSIVDKSVFWRFFDREPVGIISEDKMIAYNQVEIVGDITSAKFQSYISDPPQIKFYTDMAKEIRRNMRVHAEMLSFVDYDEPPIFFSDQRMRETFNRIVSSLEDTE